MTGEVAEALDVDCTDVLDENASCSAINVDLGPKRRRFGARRRWRHEHNRPREERVGLHNYAKPAPALLAAHTSRKSQGEDVTPAHAGSP